MLIIFVYVYVDTATFLLLVYIHYPNDNFCRNFKEVILDFSLSFSVKYLFVHVIALQSESPPQRELPSHTKNTAPELFENSLVVVQP